MSLLAFEVLIIAIGTIMLPLVGFLILALNRISSLDTRCEHLEERNKERRGDMTKIYDRLGSIEKKLASICTTLSLKTE